MAKKQKIKLAIGTPTTGLTRVEWASSLLDMQQDLLHDAALGIEDIKLFFYSTSVIPKNRHVIVENAQKWGATHILWIDDDMVFPPIAARSLIYSMKKNPTEYRILGANCVKRQYPIRFMATGLDGKEVVSYNKSGIEQVFYTGNAFVLMDMKLFDEFEKPWFAFGWNPIIEDFGTEDIYFMARVFKEKEIKTYVDHDVSNLIDHVGFWFFRPQHFTPNAPEEKRKEWEQEVVNEPVAAS